MLKHINLRVRHFRESSDIVFVFVVEFVFVFAFGIVDGVFLIHITCFIIMLKWYNDITYTKCLLSHCRVCPSRRISEGISFCSGQLFDERLWRPTDKHDIFDL